MTHDELITELNRRLEIALYNGDPQAIHALRAVVELHKPFKDSWKEKMQCEYCVNLCHSETGLGCEDIDAVYPCDTIEAIEFNLQ